MKIQSSETERPASGHVMSTNFGKLDRDPTTENSSVKCQTMKSRTTWAPLGAIGRHWAQKYAAPKGAKTAPN